jgi:hypothetical protein
VEDPGLLPDRLFLVGDVACTFDPLWGQGMTAAALGASLLGRTLTDAFAQKVDLDSVAHSFHVALAELVDSPWWQSTTLDVAMPTTEAAPPLWTDVLAKWYLYGCASQLTTADAQRLLVEVRALMKPPSAAWEPTIFVAAIREWLRRWDNCTSDEERRKLLPQHPKLTNSAWRRIGFI